MSASEKATGKSNRRLRVVGKGVHVGDSRELVKKLAPKSIDVTVTSPPYFDLKDYGTRNQIGFGQSYADYLDDLSAVFGEIFEATKDDGSLWIIVDTFRRDQEVLPLPFDLAAKLKSFGWTLRDIVIWKKERTLPWTHEGTTRKIFEYILVFSKGPNLFRYHPDSVRDTSDLKRWWVRYPERYNPRGKSLEEVWSYDIPTQGSWGAEYVRHFCPLPTGLVSRILQLTTQPGDVVLDPFAGSGTVPTVSHLLERQYVGFELNPDYVRMFRKHLKRELEKNKAQQTDLTPASSSVEEFAKTVLNLRMLKFGRLIARELDRADSSERLKIFVIPQSSSELDRFKLCHAKYVIYLASKQRVEKAIVQLAELVLKPPLSKFGVQAELVVGRFPSTTSKPIINTVVYEYSLTNSHSFKRAMSFSEAMESKRVLFSTLAMKVEVPDD